MEPKVSIIIPVYNVEPFLARCLDSVVGQTLRGIEIICVDDGSPDRSIDILNRYAAQDDRIRVISQENRGLGGARNRGFDAATGEFIRLCRCPPDFYVMNKLLRREMLLRLGLRFRERVCYEDVEYTMRLLGEGGVLVTVPDVVYRYVVNGASITKSRQTPKKQQDKYLAHKAFVAYADARGIRLDARFRRITRRSFGRWGLTWLKIKECGDRETYRLFDLIPVWRKRVTDKQACDGH